MLYMNSTDCSKVAIHECRRKMTRFLIQSGADVDTLEPRHPEDYGWLDRDSM